MKTKHNRVRVVAASVTGPLHCHKKLPCQDYFKFRREGKNFVAVVSDGAGSARYGKVGARVICETIIDHLKNTKPHQVIDKTYHAVDVARHKLCHHRLNKQKSSGGLNDFAATIVGVVYNSGQGCFFHIGDGAALAFHSDGDLNDFVASRPENGCFSCETYFYTQDNWRENLRFTRFEDFDTVFLMSDGLTNFAFSHDYQRLEKGFILPIHNFLSAQKTQTRACRALANTLDNVQARKLNSDDKTLLWAQF